MRLWQWFLCLVFISACTTRSDKVDLELPDYVEAFAYPQDNMPSPAKVELGRFLFYEKALSLDSSVSCASCHIQEFGFADTARVSRGFKNDTGFRNATGLTNVAFQNSFFRDGGVNSLERAVHPPVLTEFEMNMDVVAMIERLNTDELYVRLFQDAYDTVITYKGVAQALASFQRTLVSFNSPYDQFLQGDESALSESAKRGLDLFRTDRLNCSTCHVEPLFLDEKQHNVGLYQVYADYGRGRVTLDSADYGKFRTPTLRNIAVTYPYMHDGSLATFNDVISFYETGGFDHPNRSPDLKLFTLTDKEKDDLIAFLNSLTDRDFLTDKSFSDPR